MLLFASHRLFPLLLMVLFSPLAAAQGAAPVPASPPPAPAPAAPAPAEAADSIVGWIELSGPLQEGPPSFTFLTDSPRHESLSALLSQLHFVRDDAKTRGLVLYLDQPELDLHQIHQISGAIAQIRARGKKVLAFSEAYDLKSYLLACAADQILLQRKGQIEIVGLGVEEMYLAGLLEKIGAKADMLQVGRFKGASEPLTRSQPSAEWSQNIDHLLDGLYDHILTTISQARGLTRADLTQAMADCLTMSDEDYVKRRLVDHLVERGMEAVTEEAFGENFEWDQSLGRAQTILPKDNPFALMQMLFKDSRPQITRSTIVLLHATGAITSGYSHRSSGPTQAGLFDSENIGSRTMVRLLGELQEDENVKGVVIRLDSPGGSALASEVIWQALRDLAEKKPVFVAVGAMAASGGYYLASACDEVYVAPSSIVGSIGVVGGKIVLGNLYQTLGISIHRRTRGPLGDIFNSVEPFTPVQRGAVESSMKRTYDLFLERVKIGRGSRLPDLDSVAEGRIFTGVQALKLGMVDKIGSAPQAIEDLAAQLKLNPGEYDVIDMPGPLSLPEYLNSIFGMADASAPLPHLAAQSPLLPLAAHTLGPRAWSRTRGILQGMLLLQQEPVLTLFPASIDIK